MEEYVKEGYDKDGPNQEETQQEGQFYGSQSMGVKIAELGIKSPGRTSNKQIVEVRHCSSWVLLE